MTIEKNEREKDLRSPKPHDDKIDVNEDKTGNASSQKINTKMKEHYVTPTSGDDALRTIRTVLAMTDDSYSEMSNKSV